MGHDGVLSVEFSPDGRTARSGSLDKTGVFTYVLLQGMAGAPDQGKRGCVSVKGLSAYLENEVPDVTYRKWGYEQVPQSALPEEDFPLAKDYDVKHQ